MNVFIYPFAFCLAPFEVTPFPCIRLRLIRFSSKFSSRNVLRRCVGEPELDRNAQPTLYRPIAATRRIKTPALDSFYSGAIKRIAAGTAMDFNLC